MVTKQKKSESKKSESKKAGAVPLAASVRESAQQIWLAGLGAFAKAQVESGKAFETLVKEGMAIQRKTQAVAEEKISEATSKMAGMASGLSHKANDIGSLASGQWDKLEGIFEKRVAKALGKLGVPSAEEVADLAARVDALNKSVQALSKSGGAKPAAKAPVKQAKPAAKAPAKAPAKPVAKAVKPVTKPAVKAAVKPAAKAKAVAKPVVEVAPEAAAPSA